MKLDIIYAKGCVKTCRKYFRAMGLRTCFTITMSIIITMTITMTMTITRTKI